MKKLVLALLIALGVSNISANGTAKNELPADLQHRVKSLNITEDEKATVLGWMKENKAATAAIIGAVAITAAGTYDHFCNNGAWRTAAVTTVEGFFTAAPAAPGAPAGNPTLWERAQSYATAKNAAMAAAVVVVIVSAYDLSKDEDKSQLKNLWKNLVGSKEKAAA